LKSLVTSVVALAIATGAVGQADAATFRSNVVRHSALSTAAGWTATATQGLNLVQATDLGAVSSAMPMQITVGLAGNRAAADSLAKAIYTPGNPMFHQFLSTSQFTAAVAPSTAAVNAVASYLSSMGFTKISVAPDRLIISATGNAGIVSKAFNTPIHAYSQFGKTIFANVSPALVPASLNGAVLSVLGLNNIQKHTDHVKSPKAEVARALKRLVRGHVQHRNVSPCLTQTALPVCALNTYFPTDLDLAYDDQNTPKATNTDIAIFTEGDMTQVLKDLYQAWQADGHPVDPIRVIPVDGGSTDTSGTDEWDIDTQSSTALAGDVKSLTLYATTSLADAALTDDFARFANDDSIPVANLSVGGCEALSYVTGEMQTDDLIFAQTAIQGQSVFVSSGDGGSQCSILINAGAPVGGPLQTEYPGSSPYVTSVGGTSLLTNTASGTYFGEIAWVNGGGGISYFENASPWQYSNISLAQTGKRLVPDIAMDADPNVSGMNTVDAGVYAGYGGTSLASPLSMGVYARLQSRHGNKLGVAAASLYQAYNFATSNSDGIVPSLPSQNALLTELYGGFNDVITGSNTGFQATPGYDLTTGIGTLDINGLYVLYGS
jgi:subtilase family serine protease